MRECHPESLGSAQSAIRYGLKRAKATVSKPFAGARGEEVQRTPALRVTGLEGTSEYPASLTTTRTRHPDIEGLTNCYAALVLSYGLR
jgi:hypothetical protein